MTEPIKLSTPAPAERTVVDRVALRLRMIQRDGSRRYVNDNVERVRRIFAWAAGEEAEKGRLAPGYLADLVVLDGDPLTVSPSAIKDLKVLLTVAGVVILLAR